MGRLFYAEAARRVPDFPPVRVYAPVGEHKDLLAYLVRRLLENGANTSFVNRFMDEQVAVADIVRDPISELERLESRPHPKLPNPVALYAERRNSSGIDVGNPRGSCRGARGRRRSTILRSRRGPDHRWGTRGGPPARGHESRRQPRLRRKFTGCDAGRDRRGIRPQQPRAARLERFGRRASSGLPRSGGGICSRGARLDFYALLVREAGKTLPDAIAEVREAVDFCRYYAVRARDEFAKGKRLEGPTGEMNELSLQGRGVFACISPWNFPLAIFAGQVTAALAAGNCVIAKPAEPTPLIAARFIKLLHEAGVAPDALHLIPAPGTHIR